MKNIYVGLSTNGLLWESKEKELITAGLNFVQISIDGPEEVHNHIRNNNQCFKKAVGAIKAAKGGGNKNTNKHSLVNGFNTTY